MNNMLPRVVSVCALALLFFSCKGNDRVISVEPGAVSSSGSVTTLAKLSIPLQPESVMSMDEVLTQLEMMSGKQEDNPAVIEQIKKQFVSALKDAQARKFTSRPPMGPANAVSDLEMTRDDGGALWLKWTYKNKGDFNLDGTVGLLDITTLAEHLFEKVGPSNEWIDATSNGIIDIADVTAVASNFFANVAAYLIEGSLKQEGPYQAFGFVLFSERKTESPTAFEFELPDNRYKFYSVVPVSNGGKVGERSNIVERNLPPVAQVSASPVVGKAPLFVKFDASASTDPDGEIVFYKWDFNGDGDYDASGAESSVSYTYESLGIYEARVSVLDNDGDEGSASVVIIVQADNLPPIAELTAEPSLGDVPLTVMLDASSSRDHDGDIVLYEWDFDGDGRYDFSSVEELVATFVYEQPGYYLPSVTVKDDEGLFSVARTMVTVMPEEWMHTLGGQSREQANSVALDKLGNVYIGGQWFNRESRYGRAYEGFVAKYSPLGSLVWMKTFGADVDWVVDISDDSEDNVVVLGLSYHLRHPEDEQADPSEVFIAKLDPQGRIVWQRSWGYEENDTPVALRIDASDNIFVLSYFVEGSESVISKWDTDGNLLWQKRFSGYAPDFALSPEGDIFVLISSDTGGIARKIILHLDPTGMFIEAKCLEYEREKFIELYFLRNLLVDTRSCIIY